MQISPEEFKKLAGIINHSEEPAVAPEDEYVSPETDIVTSSDACAMRDMMDKLNVSEADVEVEEAGEWDNEPNEQDLDQPKGEPVDTSLRRHLGADPQHVKVDESVIEDYTSFDLYEAYEAHKKQPLKESAHVEFRDPAGKYIVVYSRQRGGYKVIGKGQYKGEFTHAGIFNEIDDAKEHAELTIDGIDEELTEDNAADMDKYVELLDSHDWFYEMSDNPTVFNDGRNERIKLLQMQKELDADFSVWNEHAPSRYRKSAKSAEKPAEKPANAVTKYQVYDTETGEQIGDLYDKGPDALRAKDKLAMSTGNFDKYSYRYVYVDPETNELAEASFDGDMAMFVIPTDASPQESELAVQIADAAGVPLNKAISFEDKDVLARNLYDAAEKLGLADVVFDLIHTTHAMQEEQIDEKKDFKGWTAVCDGVEKLISYGQIKTMNDALKKAAELFSCSPAKIDIKPIYESINEGVWDMHNTDVKHEKGATPEQADQYTVKNKRLKKKVNRVFGSWSDAMAAASKLGGKAEGWEVMLEAKVDEYIDLEKAEKKAKEDNKKGVEFGKKKEAVKESDGLSDIAKVREEMVAAADQISYVLVKMADNADIDHELVDQFDNARDTFISGMKRMGIDKSKFYESAYDTDDENVSLRGTFDYALTSFANASTSFKQMFNDMKAEGVVLAGSKDAIAGYNKMIRVIKVAKTQFGPFGV